MLSMARPCPRYAPGRAGTYLPIVAEYAPGISFAKRCETIGSESQDAEEQRPLRRSRYGGTPAMPATSHVEEAAMRWQRLLVPLDLSPDADDALEYAVRKMFQSCGCAIFAGRASESST
jgi:hypothetical protein